MDSVTAHSSEAAGTRARNLPLVALLTTVWVAWVAFTLVALVQHGIGGFFEAVLHNTAVIQVTIDFVFSLAVALVLMRPDARRRGIPYWPYLLATMATGSIGLIAYLIHRTWRGRPSGHAY